MLKTVLLYLSLIQVTLLTYYYSNFTFHIHGLKSETDLSMLA